MSFSAASRVFVVAAVVACQTPNKHSQEVQSAEPASKPQAQRSVPVTVEDVERVRINSLKKPQIPPVEAVESMIAECYGHILSPFVADTAPFTIPTKHYDELMKHFRDAELDDSPWVEDHEIGTIRLKFVHGRTLRICWFWTGKKGRMSFSFAGIRYKTVGKKFADDETLEFDNLVRKIGEN